MFDSDEIFDIKTEERFNKLALDTFRYQASNCEIYKEYVKLLEIDPLSISNVEQIPFLPIEFFKTKQIYSSHKKPEITFTSSRTSGMETSKHFVADVSVYEKSFFKGFEYFYGNPREYAILALLPSYLERKGSSLIYMVEHLIKLSKYSESNFFLKNHNELYDVLKTLQAKFVPTILIGVSFALLDFVEARKINFPNLIVMETGGMKGRREEMLREELHEKLCEGFGVKYIHSEYGMTELLSQAYSKQDGFFITPPWMKVLIRDSQDPFLYVNDKTAGGINIIDLANVYSCSFIETQDIGRRLDSKGFEILGRFDSSDVRGCNLLILE